MCLKKIFNTLKRRILKGSSFTINTCNSWSEIGDWNDFSNIGKTFNIPNID